MPAEQRESPVDVASLSAAASRAGAMTRASRENFPVAPRVLPRGIRTHLLAIYGFARLVDDTGDERAGDRAAHLDALERDLDRVFSGGDPEHPLLADLVPTVRACGLDQEPFRQLIQANRQDQQVRRYERLTDLLGYCELSANPVGHLVLQVFGAASPGRRRLSDAVCTALQLVEHLQDVAEDLGRDRIYLPAEDMARFGVRAADLASAPASAAVRRLVAFEARRARAWLDIGSGLVPASPALLAVAVAGFVAGGHATLDSMEAVDHDVLAHSVLPHPGRVLVRWSRLLVGWR
ncbi:MAG TPA: squalene synthase HpnC [Mycobacteriales bacterium]|nr:squalene synthase HpnC [Mycobacteriales bacterium]